MLQKFFQMVEMNALIYQLKYGEFNTSIVYLPLICT